MEVLAMESLPQFAVATCTGFNANSSNLSHFTKVVGICLKGARRGFRAEVVTDGVVENPAWKFQHCPVYLNGTILSATPPETGFSQMVGMAQDVGTIMVEIHEPYLLTA